MKRIWASEIDLMCCYLFLWLIKQIFILIDNLHSHAGEIGACGTINFNIQYVFCGTGAACRCKNNIEILCF